MDVMKNSIIENGRDVIRIECDAIRKIENSLGDDFVNAVSLILNAKGNVIFSGVGKSGHIARKLAATFASTGTSSYFVHASEAAHGDLGMIRKDDVFIAISFSGESTELMLIVPFLKAMNIPIIAMCGHQNSSLARIADINLMTSIEREACPLNLAPTASTTVTMVLGDAMAGALMKARGFNENDFARSHPAGALGRRLLLKVNHIMRKGNDIPVVREDTPALDAITVMAKKHIGCFIVENDMHKPVGIFTEGDLCRKMRIGINFSKLTASQIMIASPKSIVSDRSAYGAMEIIRENQINQVVVVNDSGELVGVVHFQDLISAKIN